MKKGFFALLFLLIILLFSSCTEESADSNGSTNTATASSSISMNTTTASSLPKPTTSDSLFEYIIEQWRRQKASELYQYADNELSSLLNKDDFLYLFDSISELGGKMNEYSKLKKSIENGIIIYRAQLDFERLYANITLSLKDLKICGFSRKLDFKNTFEIKRDGNIIETYFQLEDDGYPLNAVYTHINDGLPHPTVLLIAGSGPSDYNETIGILTPFEDIANGLAMNGINSLRVDKRTLNYAKEFDVYSGIFEEYYSAIHISLSFLKGLGISEIYLLGHSLGGQIATEIAANDKDISGIILFNSSARHLADIACDQYTENDPSKKTYYATLAEAAKRATSSTSQGHYYFGASDYYWASYNEIDMIENLFDSNSKTLIINSANDRQTFDADIRLWELLCGKFGNCFMLKYPDISHYGYKINTEDPASFYQRAVFPTEIISAFSAFIKEEH